MSDVAEAWVRDFDAFSVKLGHQELYRKVLSCCELTCFGED